MTGLVCHGEWTCPISSRHSAGIGRPSSSRRYQSTTSSTFLGLSEKVTRSAFRTFAAASAAIRFVNTAAYGVFDIHQITRYVPVFDGGRSSFVTTRTFLRLAMRVGATAP